MERGKSDTEAATEYVVSTILQQEKGFFRPDRFGNPLFFFPPPPTLELQHSFQFRTKEKYISAESSPDAFSFSLFWALIGGGLPTGAHTQKSLFSSLFPFLGKGIFNYNPRRKERNCGDHHRSSHHNLYFQT